MYDAKTGIVEGFHNAIEIVRRIIADSKTRSIRFCVMDLEFRDSISGTNIVLDLNYITSENTIVDSNFYLIPTEDDEVAFDIELRKSQLIKEIRNSFDMYSAAGSFLLINDELRRFHFSYDNQFKLKDILDNYSSGDTVYYGERFGSEEFTYDQIRYIYISLFNNKIYNQIYADVLCRWIQNYYTDEMYNAKDPIVTYGYWNDAIVGEVNRRYEKCRLSK